MKACRCRTYNSMIENASPLLLGSTREGSIFAAVAQSRIRLKPPKFEARVALSGYFPARFGGKRASLFEAVRCANFPRMPGSFIRWQQVTRSQLPSLRIFFGMTALATERLYTSR